MAHYRFGLGIALIVLILFLPACGTIFPTPTPSPAPPTFTPTPSATSTPTPTPTPTPIPTSTLTPTITLTPTSTQAPNTILTIRAWIDGISHIIIKRDTVRWYQMGADAPGRWNHAIKATYLNGKPWYPEWPDKPDTRNRDCYCQSSQYVGIAPLSPVAQTVRLELIQARGATTIDQQPSSHNDYTLVILFDDGPPGGPEWYEIKVYYYSAH